MKKTFFLVLSLAIVAWAVFALLRIAQHPQTENIRSVLKNRTANSLRNFWDNLTTSRRAPLTTLELEEHLKNSLPVPFAKFSEEEWQWFWHLLYGKFSPDSGGWPKRERQLSQEEIQNILADTYQKPFGRFGPKQWDIFWQQILKGRVF